MPFVSDRHWRRREGRALTRTDLRRAVISGAVERVRPKMMTVTAIMAGLLPILWSTGTGSELMRRIAAPMVGGMISSAVLTLLVIPALYALVKGWRLPAAKNAGGTERDHTPAIDRIRGRGSAALDLRRTTERHAVSGAASAIGLVTTSAVLAAPNHHCRMDLDRLAAAVRGAARHDHTGGPISYMQEQIRRANVDHAAGREQVFCECITAAQRMAPQLVDRI